MSIFKYILKYFNESTQYVFDLDIENQLPKYFLNVNYFLLCLFIQYLYFFLFNIKPKNIERPKNIDLRTLSLRTQYEKGFIDRIEKKKSLSFKSIRKIKNLKLMINISKEDYKTPLFYFNGLR